MSDKTILCTLMLAAAAALLTWAPAAADHVKLRLDISGGGINARINDDACRSVIFAADRSRPHDPSQDISVGGKGYNVMSIGKHIDSASPALLHASKNGSSVDGSVSYYKDGARNPYETVELSNATIVSVSRIASTNAEEVKVAFQGISYTLASGATMAPDHWYLSNHVLHGRQSVAAHKSAVKVRRGVVHDSYGKHREKTYGVAP